MATITANWEDTETNRIVEVSIDYILGTDRLEIERVTPTSVTFLDSISGEPLRTIGVWTCKGAEHLVSKIRQLGGIEHLERKLEQAVLASA